MAVSAPSKGSGFDREVEQGIERGVEVAGRWWFVWLPPLVVAVFVWGWWNEAWFGAEGWDTVRAWLWVAGAVVVVAGGLRVWWVVRSVPRRKGQERASDAVVAAKVDGRAVVTARDGVGGFIQLDRETHLAATQRKHLAEALSEKLGAPIELGAVDSKDRLSFRREHSVEGGDVLAATIPALPFPQVVDLSRLHVGTRADGSPFLLDVTEGRHTLVAGSTRSGKGSVIHSILRQLAPAIKAGVVRVIFVDPKFGAEGLPVRAICDRVMVCDGRNLEDVAAFMDGLVGECQRDAGRLAQRGLRKHVASVEHPYTVVIIDEVASLSKYLGSSQTQRACEAAIGGLTTMGASAGWLVIGALQDPRKEVISIRNLFPQRIALRLAEPNEVDWVLGSAVRERGALCHLIPKNRQGTGFVAEDGDPDPVKVRFAFPTDTDIADMVRRFPAPKPPTVFGLPEGFFG